MTRCILLQYSLSPCVGAAEDRKGEITRWTARLGRVRSPGQCRRRCLIHRQQAGPRYAARALQLPHVHPHGLVVHSTHAGRRGRTNEVAIARKSPRFSERPHAGWHIHVHHDGG